MTMRLFLIATLLIIMGVGGSLYIYLNDRAAPSPLLGDGASTSSVQSVQPTGDTTPISTIRPVQLSPVYKRAITTQFWVGESSNESNGFISNHESYWDDAWMTHFGGIDTPECRIGYYPCGFVPQENPFYVALPYGEFEEGSDILKRSAQNIPWFSSNASESLLKNRWIEVVYQGKVCYGQWQDVGPFLTDDFDYVFGSNPPTNTFGEQAGLDISPALWDCLGLTTNEVTEWRFVNTNQVPDGPWKKIITTRGISWGQ